jgi:hypothetical protein
VAAPVYIAAFAPDKGESVNTLLAGFPTDVPGPPILPLRDGLLLLYRDKFHGSFAADLPAEQAAFMADSQVPWGVDALAGQAELVPGDDRGSDDPATRPAGHVPADRFHGGRGRRKPRHLRVTAGRGGRAHRACHLRGDPGLTHYRGTSVPLGPSADPAAYEHIPNRQR